MVILISGIFLLICAVLEWLCNLAPEPGQLGCLGSLTAFYFDAASGECHSFVYSGCGGNANNFPSHKKCMDTCKGDSFLLNC